MKNNSRIVSVDKQKFAGGVNPLLPATFCILCDSDISSGYTRVIPSEVEESIMRSFYVYILSNYTNTTLYIGVTSDLLRRIEEHKSGVIDGFTKKYNVKKLVYVEKCANANDAIAREKQLKKWRREKKEMLINSINPNWNDLSLL